MLRACGFCRQGKIEGQMRRRNHWPIICIVPAEAINGNLATAWALPGYAHTPQACGQRPASVGQCLTANYFGDFLQGCSDKTVSGSIDGQFVEAASYLSSIK